MKQKLNLTCNLPENLDPCFNQIELFNYQLTKELVFSSKNPLIINQNLIYYEEILLLFNDQLFSAWKTKKAASAYKTDCYYKCFDHF
jgi:hypothetical protein